MKTAALLTVNTTEHDLTSAGLSVGMIVHAKPIGRDLDWQRIEVLIWIYPNGELAVAYDATELVCAPPIKFRMIECGYSGAVSAYR